MSSWYVYRGNEPPLGPWPTETIAEGILAGTLSPDTWVAAPSGSRWLRARDVPVIAALLDGEPTARAPVLADAPERPYWACGDTLESPGNERPPRR